jgi:hypothetical protein
MNSKRIRYGFKETTNFYIATGIDDILCSDAWHFGFRKNGQPNLGGFINALIPGLNQYREDLHERFLEENGNNEELVGVIEKNLFGIYLKTFDLSDDALTNISFRINTEHKDDFVQIHDEILRKVDMSFSAYLVSLLNEYAGKPFFLREILFQYRIVEKIVRSIDSSSLTAFHLKDGNVIEAVPLGVEPILLKGGNQIPAISFDKKSAFLISLGDIQKANSGSQQIDISQKDSDFVMAFIDKRLAEEAKEQ